MFLKKINRWIVAETTITNHGVIFSNMSDRSELIINDRNSMNVINHDY